MKITPVILFGLLTLFPLNSFSHSESAEQDPAIEFSPEFSPSDHTLFQPLNRKDMNNGGIPSDECSFFSNAYSRSALVGSTGGVTVLAQQAGGGGVSSAFSGDSDGATSSEDGSEEDFLDGRQKGYGSEGLSEEDDLSSPSNLLLEVNLSQYKLERMIEHFSL
jgi:hypothetical protein